MKTKQQLSTIANQSGNSNNNGGQLLVNSPNGGSLSNSPVNVNFGVNRPIHVEPILALNEQAQQQQQQHQLQQYTAQIGDVSGTAEDGYDPLSSNTILTRSAAVRAAQQMKLHQQRHHHHVGNSSSSSRPRNAALGGSIGQHQHILGKIVKPIPVRPISSSSSTHSSSFSASSCINLIKNNDTSAVTVNQQPAAAAQSTHTLSSCDQMPNFSLIAKYFASFPATRLKTNPNVSEPSHGGATVQPAFIPSSSQSPLSFTTSSFAAPAAVSTKPNDHQLFKMTPFLPFKKSHFGKHQPTQLQQYHINVTPSLSQQQVHAQPHHQPIMHLPGGNKSHCAAIQPIGQNNHLTVNGELKPIDIGVMTRNSYQNQYTNANFAAKIGATNVGTTVGGQLGSQTTASTMHNSHNQSMSNTDHLCTNFKRLIKLNDQTDVADLYAHVHSPASPHTATSNTPTLDAEPACDRDAAVDSTDQPWFGQITMETRSTRKFLIKHHPYLQFNHNNNTNTASTTTNNTRPSINLIKMKKLNKKNASPGVDCVKQPSLKTMSRSSGRFNAADGCEMDRLLKFTDLAPSPTANGKQTRQQHPKPQQQTKLSTAGKSNRLRSARKHAPNNNNNNNSLTENEHLSFYNDPTTTATSEFVFYDLGEENEPEQDGAEYDCRLDDDMDDSKEEESSGYYSSYHSVDLISSSGGSSGGDLNRQSKLAAAHAANSQVLNKYQPTTVLVNHTNATNASSSNSNSNSASDTQSKLNQPHHHYHTRYLSNILLQTTNQTTANNPLTTSTTTTTSSSTTTKPSTPANNNKSINTPPCTRLRYQQLLAAAAQSNDLDLDQIEND